jgi:hypothetical protein
VLMISSLQACEKAASSKPGCSGTLVLTSCRLDVHFLLSQWGDAILNLRSPIELRSRITQNSNAQSGCSGNISRPNHGDAANIVLSVCKMHGPIADVEHWTIISSYDTVSVHRTPGVTERPLRHLHAHHRNEVIEPYTIAIITRIFVVVDYGPMRLF